MAKAKTQKPKPLAFRIELIRLILKFCTKVDGVDGPFHLRGTYVLHTLPQERFVVFKSFDRNGKVKKANIAKRSALLNTYTELKISEVKFWIQKINYYVKETGAGTS